MDATKRTAQNITKVNWGLGPFHSEMRRLNPKEIKSTRGKVLGDEPPEGAKQGKLGDFMLKFFVDGGHPSRIRSWEARCRQCSFGGGGKGGRT